MATKEIITNITGSLSSLPSSSPSSELFINSSSSSSLSGLPAPPPPPVSSAEELANITEIASQLLSSTISSVVGLINGSNVAGDDNDSSSGYAGLANGSSLIDGIDGLGSGNLTDKIRSGAAVEVPDGEGSSSVFAAWVGLGILLVGIVFILGFVFVYDRIIRKRYLGKEQGEEVADESEPKPKPTSGGDVEKGKSESKTPEADPEEEEEEGEEEEEKDDDGPPEPTPAGEQSSFSGPTNRKRQEKQDETNQVELKPL